MIQTKEQLDALTFSARDGFLRAVQITDQRILDVGCGDGRFTLQHFGDAATVHGLDTKDDEIAKAIESLQELSHGQRKRFQFTCADIVDRPLAKASFDIAIFLRSF